MSKEERTYPANPFKAQQKRGQEDTLKYCAWEVLKDFPQGLDSSRIAQEVQERGLRDLSKMKNASAQISSELVRAKNAFSSTSGRKTWWIRAFAPSELRRKADMSETPRGAELEGLRVAVWWKGERRYFEGVIERYDAASQFYKVAYDDGDTDDGLEFRKYKLSRRDNKPDLVVVLEHNLDDVDESSSHVKGTMSSATATSKDEGSVWTSSTGQGGCSADSLMGVEYSDSTPRQTLKGLRETRSKRTRKAASLEHSRPSNVDAEKTVMSSPGVRADVTEGNEMCGVESQLSTPKRKSEVTGEGHNRKKTKTAEQTPKEELPSPVSDMGARLAKVLIPETPSEVKRIGPVPRDHAQVLGLSRSVDKDSHPATVTSPQSVTTPGPLQTNMARVFYKVASPERKQPQKKPEPDGTASQRQGWSHRSETIDVLHLTKQLTPSGDKRPDLKNLIDVGELMSLSELSSELKRGNDNTEEVTSRCTGVALKCPELKAEERNGRPFPHSMPRPVMAMKTELLEESGADLRLRSLPGPQTIAATQYPSQRLASLHGAHRMLMHVPASVRPDRPIVRGRELLSPSILPTQKNSMEVDGLSTAMPFMGSAAAHRHGIPPPVFIPPEAGLPVQAYDCPVVRSTSATKTDMQREALMLHEASGLGNLKNNSDVSHIAMFKSAPHLSRTPMDKSTAGRGQWNADKYGSSWAWGLEH